MQSVRLAEIKRSIYLENIRVKGLKNGILVQYNPELTFDEILIITKEKFSQSRKFFSSSTVSVKFEGVDLSSSQETILCDAIMDSCDLKIACVICDEDIDQNSVYDNSLHLVKDLMEKNDVLFYRGNVINGQTIKSEKDIIIIGDVNPGCRIVSAKDILVFGGMYGEAYAGTGEKISMADNSRMILALELAPEELYIGTKQYKPPKKSVWGHKIKLLPSIAYIDKDKITIQNYSKELMDKLNERNI